MSSPPRRALVSSVTASTAAASARLVRAVSQLHDDLDIIVLDVDGTKSPAEQVIEPNELHADRIEIGRRLARTTPRSGAAALLPEAARLALATYDEVIIADPAIEVVGRLDDLALVGDEPIRVVPRILEALPVDDRHPGAVDAHHAGVYLPTLLTVGPAASDHLSWWSEAMAREPATRGVLLDQMTAWLAHTVCRAPSQGITAARRPTTVIASIDTTDHRAAAPHQFVPGARHPLSADVALATVLDARDRETAPDRDDEPRAATWLYANALRRHELLDEPEPPLPDSPRFRKWLREPFARPDGLCRSAMELWHHRPDLQLAFPDPDLGPVTRAAFMEWVRRDGIEQVGFAPDWVAPLPEHRTAELQPGVDLAGYIDAELGVGEIARLVLAALDTTELETSVQTIGGSANQRRDAPPDDGPRHPIEVLCVNADRVAPVVASRGRDPSIVRTIGVFFWETDEVTDAMVDGLQSVDEIWAGSHYVAQNLRRHTDTAVHVVPIPIVPPPPEGDGRALLGVAADQPTVLFTFDFHSVSRRKNPDGLIDAYRLAAGADDGSVLVLKSINGDRVPDELERLRWMTRDRDDIRIVDGYCSAGELSAMIEAADVYVSLHRSEGFGLTIGHAMALGTPVVVTEGSGPADFLDDASATIVPAAQVTIGEGASPYPAHGTWWEPDIASAAEGISRLLSDPARAARQADTARAAVETHSIERTAAFLEERLRHQTFRRRWRR